MDVRKHPHYMSTFNITPLGTSPAWYNFGEPASGFLLETSESRVLIDCGSGAIAKYLELYGDAPIDAIVITHVHADHCFDLIPLKYGITLGALKHWKPQLWLPPGAHDRLKTLVSAWNSGEDFFIEAFDVKEYSGEGEFNVGSLVASAMLVPHYIECFALRFEHEFGSFGYTADLGPNSKISEFMSDVDVLLSEASLTDDDDLSAPDRGHITAREAGAIAAKARASMLMLTHVPYENGIERAVSDAKECFSGEVCAASSGHKVEITQRRKRLSA